MPFEPTDPEPIEQPDKPDASTVTDLIEPAEDPAEEPDADPAEQPEEPDASDAEEPDADPAEDPEEPDGRLKKARDDAARYRRELRAAEADRDAAREMLTAARSQIAEAAHEASYIGQFIPWAALAAMVAIDDLFSEDGLLDPDRHAELAEQTAKRLGLPTTSGGYSGVRGAHLGPAQRETPPGPAFESAFAPRSRR